VVELVSAYAGGSVIRVVRFFPNATILWWRQRQNSAGLKRFRRNSAMSFTATLPRNLPGILREIAVESCEAFRYASPPRVGEALPPAP
jgi:hypothetical protein